MSLRNLLARGIEATLASESARAELATLIADAGLPADAADHVRHTLEAVPGLLGSIYETLGRADAGAPCSTPSSATCSKKTT